MKPITEEAIELISKFATGASCKVDLNDLESRMFWPSLMENSKGKDIINEDDVKKYIFEQHAVLVFRRYELGQLTKEQAIGCITQIENRDGKLICVHGGKKVCEISKQEADLINQVFKRYREKIKEGS